MERDVCGLENAWMQVRCIRPRAHDGQHRGSRMEPRTVWWVSDPCKVCDGQVNPDGRCNVCGEQSREEGVGHTTADAARASEGSSDLTSEPPPPVSDRVVVTPRVLP